MTLLVAAGQPEPDGNTEQAREHVGPQERSDQLRTADDVVDDEGGEDADAAGAEEALLEANRCPEDGIDQELLDHVRRLGGLIGDLTRNHRPAGNNRAGKRS